MEESTPSPGTPTQLPTYLPANTEHRTPTHLPANGTNKGTIIRVIRRLEELLRQLASASHAIGNMELKSKFGACSAAIKRDIVFAASLYL